MCTYMIYIHMYTYMIYIHMYTYMIYIRPAAAPINDDINDMCPLGAVPHIIRGFLRGFNQVLL